MTTTGAMIKHLIPANLKRVVLYLQPISMRWGTAKLRSLCRDKLGIEPDFLDCLPVREQEPRLLAGLFDGLQWRPNAYEEARKWRIHRARAGTRRSAFHRYATLDSLAHVQVVGGWATDLSTQVRATPRLLHTQSPRAQLFGNLHHHIPPLRLRRQNERLRKRRLDHIRQLVRLRRFRHNATNDRAPRCTI